MGIGTYASVPVVPESIDALVEADAEGECTCEDGGDVYAWKVEVESYFVVLAWVPRPGG